MLTQPTNNIQSPCQFPAAHVNSTGSVPGKNVEFEESRSGVTRKPMAGSSTSNQFEAMRRHANHSGRKTPRRRKSAPGSGNPIQPKSNASSMALYLHQALQSPLLTAVQEQRLARNISRFRAAFQRLTMKEPAVIDFLVDLLNQWNSRQVRLDAICNLALSETAKRKTLEPRIRTNLKPLSRLSNRMASAASKLERRQLHREAVQRIESLWIRPVPFENAPFTNPIAKMLLERYRKLCRTLTNANLRLVVGVAKQMCGNSPILLDMIQEGNRGLMHAVTKFDHQRNIRFSTYATPWIKQAIYAALPNWERNIRIPENFGSMTRALQRRLQNTGDFDLDYSRLDSGRNLAWIADEMNLPVGDVDRILCIQRDTCSLSQSGRSRQQDGSETASTLAERLTDQRRFDPLQSAQLSERREFIRRLLDRVLDNREHRVISLRFGFEDGKDRSLAEVGRELGITRERVRQIEKRAIAKLGHTQTPQQFV